MRELLYTFQRDCLLAGYPRTVALQRLISAALAYNAPCVIGSLSDMKEYYRTMVTENVLEKVSAVNEVILLDTDKVLKDILLLWEGRYLTLNSPSYSDNQRRFFAEIADFGQGVEETYRAWIDRFVKAF